MTTQDHEFLSYSDEEISDGIRADIREAVFLQTIGLIERLVDSESLTNREIVKVISDFAESTVEAYPEHPILENTIFKLSCHMLLNSLRGTER